MGTRDTQLRTISRRTEPSRSSLLFPSVSIPPQLLDLLTYLYRRYATQMISTMFLVTVPWMQVSQTAMNKPDLPVESILATFALASGLHMLFIAFNSLMVRVLRIGGASGVEG